MRWSKRSITRDFRISMNEFVQQVNASREAMKQRVALAAEGWGSWQQEGGTASGGVGGDAGEEEEEEDDGGEGEAGGPEVANGASAHAAAAPDSEMHQVMELFGSQRTESKAPEVRS